MPAGGRAHAPNVRVLAAFTVLVVALATALARVEPAASVGTWTNYCDGVFYVSNMQCWSSGWNYYYANRMFQSSNPSGLPVRVMEHQPNGSWVNTTSGNGEVSICHVRIYVETGSQNISQYSYYASSEKLTGAHVDEDTESE